MFLFDFVLNVVMVLIFIASFAVECFEDAALFVIESLVNGFHWLLCIGDL